MKWAKGLMSDFGYFVLGAALGVLAMYPTKSCAANEQEAYKAHAVAMEAKYEIQQNLLVSICYHESRFRNLTGAAGEIGPCQIKPSTLRAMGYVQQAPFYLAVGSVGPRVEQVNRAVSKALKLEFLYGPKVAVYTEHTAKAIRAFQERNRLQIDGIVGPQTWKALFNEAMPGTVTIEQELRNPFKNIEFAAIHLKHLERVLGTDDPGILAAAYNGGSNHPHVKYMLRIVATQQELNSQDDSPLKRLRN